MGKEIRTRTLHYRYVSFLNGTAELQPLLAKALAKLSLVGNRLEYMTENQAESRVINNHRNFSEMQFGNLLYFERGANKLLLSTDIQVAALDVAQVAPPPLKGKPSEFLDSILYFGIHKNHVVLLQSMGLKTKHLEAHLNWILQAAKVIDPEQRLELVDSAKPNVRQAIESRPIKTVRFGSPFLHLDSALEGSPSRETKRLAPKGIGASIMKALLGAKELSKLHLEDALDGNLKVVLEISYDRKTDDGGQKALQSIARALRHIDEDEVAIKIPGLGTVRGSDLKISEQIRVDAYNGVIDPDDVWPNMREWLVSLIEQKVVSDNNA